MSRDSATYRLAHSTGFAHVSRVLISMEMLFIMAPVTVLLLILFSALWGSGGSFRPRDLGPVILVLFAAVPCACGWRLAIALLFRGRADMARLAAPIWWGASLGALLTVAGLAATVLPRSMFEALNQIGAIFRPFAFGAPLLLPFLHLLLERKLAALAPAGVSARGSDAGLG